MTDAPKSWDEVNGTSHITSLPTPKPANRFYRISGRRSSDFAVLSRDFQISGITGAKSADDARKYIAFLRGRGFDQITAEFHMVEKITLGVLESQP